MNKKLFIVVSMLLLASMVLTACGETIKTVIVENTKIVTEKETQVVVEKQTEIVVATPEPIKRKGAWVDRVVMVEEGSQEAAVKRIQAGEIDVYAYSCDDSNVFNTVKSDPNLSYVMSFGSYNETTINPVGPEFTDGRLNPFSVPAVREAMNWLLDRNYIVQEIMDGLATPKLLPITSAFPDYARYVADVRKLEAYYAYNPDKAKEVITAEMEKLGATLVDGKWTYKDAPVEILFVIRVEDERKTIGDYVSNQLETVGFTVNRMYKTRSEASPIWVRSNPADGQWHLYTGGWITTAIDRDQGGNFSFFYTPRDYPIPLHQAYTPSPEFDEAALKLSIKDFTSLEERDALFPVAMELALKDSVRVWQVDQQAFSPLAADIAVTYDLAGGISGAALWPFTLRIKDQIGGSVTIAQPGLLVDPWNPIAGSNWIYDMMPIRATQDYGTIVDPYTGLYWPQRIEKAEVVAEEGLPIGKTLDWLDLKFEAQITVPADAWADWDAVNQKWITVGEKFPDGATAKSKVTVTYPADLWTTVKWHDGSPITVGDFMMGMIIGFDRGKEDSPIFDAAAKENLDAFLDHFKGVKIVSVDPFVIETYDDLWYLDAEWMVSTWWPNYSYGTGPWQVIGLGVLTELGGELAFSADKADEKGVEWMSLVAGPSLDILKKYLQGDGGELAGAIADNYIPYAPTMGQYVTADEAALRWANLQKWYAVQGHFWVGCGPFFVDKVFPVEGTITLLRFEDFPDMADKWARFAAPAVAVVDVEGPGSVVIGNEATFDVFVTFEGNPYPAKDISQVKFLLFDATGTMVYTAPAEFVADGQYVIKLSAEVTGKLAEGSNKIEVAVSPIIVSIPSFDAFDFVTTK